VVVVRRATGRNQGDVSADYGISGVISGSAAPAALRHPSAVDLHFRIVVSFRFLFQSYKIINREVNSLYRFVVS
jgi:hypothetical protein